MVPVLRYPPFTAVSALPRAADIISDHLGKAALEEIEMASLECPACLQLRCGFHSRTQLSILVHTVLHRQIFLFFFTKCASSIFTCMTP